MIGIYKLTSPTGKIYIGKSITIEKRLNLYRLGHCTTQPKLHNSINKYGFEGHEVDILEECDESIINEREVYWIEYYNSVENGLNCTYGGEGGRLCEETKQKISKGRVGIKSATTKHNPIYQYDLNGDFIKEWHNARQCASELGINNGYLHAVLKTNGKKTMNNWRFIREKVDKLFPTTKNAGNKKQVIQYDKKNNMIKEFESAIQASRELNLFIQGITSTCRGEKKTCGGFIFKYKDFAKK